MESYEMIVARQTKGIEQASMIYFVCGKSDCWCEPQQYVDN